MRMSVHTNDPDDMINNFTIADAVYGFCKYSRPLYRLNPEAVANMILEQVRADKWEEQRNGEPSEPDE